MSSLNGYTLNEYQFIKKIGAGTYGLIYLVQDSAGNEFAAKLVLKHNNGPKGVTANKEYIQNTITKYFEEHPSICAREIDLHLIEKDGVHCDYLKEISLHLRVHRHPNVVTIHKVLGVGDLGVAIIMDHYEQGDLFYSITDKQIFQKCPESRRQGLMKNAMFQLIEVVHYCQQQNVFHCDLKPENILVRYNPKYVRSAATPVDRGEIHLVLIDFGLSCEDSLICCNSCRGSSYYMAPERVTNYNTTEYIRSCLCMKSYVNLPNVPLARSLYFPTLAGDIWSLGILFINITCAKNPWPIAKLAHSPEAMSGVFNHYMFSNRNILSSILPISWQFNRLLDEIFKLGPSERIKLPELQKKLLGCDLFNSRIPSSPVSEYEWGSEHSELNSDSSQHSDNYIHQHRETPCTSMDSDDSAKAVKSTSTY